MGPYREPAAPPSPAPAERPRRHRRAFYVDEGVFNVGCFAAAWIISALGLLWAVTVSR